MKRLALVATVLALGFVRGLAPAEEIRFARFPEISPDGRRIAFSYDGDIWTVARDDDADVLHLGPSTFAAVTRDLIALHLGLVAGGHELCFDVVNRSLKALRVVHIPDADLSGELLHMTGETGRGICPHGQSDIPLWEASDLVAIEDHVPAKGD